MKSSRPPKFTLPPAAVSKLVRWFQRNQLPMPWRKTRDPYAIWISEAMLQQTQIKTVIPYYHKFLKRFPTTKALAQAPMDDVLKTWEGLGYYSRARNLHRAAQMLVRDSGGRLPQEEADLRKLPGIGRYTAAAIASMAFHRPVPVLDGNVKRVLARLCAIKKDLASKTSEDELYEILKRAIPKKYPGLFNQAMMELGQRICLPRNPHCTECPVSSHCKAYGAGTQDRLPIRTKKPQVPVYEIGIGVIWKNGKILIGRRPENGLLGGLWEFPGGKRKHNETFEACVEREAREETGLRVRTGPYLTTVRHRYSHFGVVLHVFHCHGPKGKLRNIGCTDYRWVTLDEIDRYAFPTANRKIIQALQNERHSPLLFATMSIRKK